MKKRFSTMILALALCMGLAVPAFAADTSGSCGDNVTWSYNNGTLTIQGTGGMANYFGVDTPWSGYREQIHTVNIGAGVTSIGMYAFARCSNLTSATIPNSVTTIGYAAFNECGSLASVTIPNSVTAIDSYAFCKCSSLSSVTIPNNVTVIGYEAFSGSGLTSVTIPNSVATIQPGAFSWCGSLSSINVAGGNPAYSSVDGILFDVNQAHLHTYPAGKGNSSYSVPTSVTTIGHNAFSGCGSLTSIIISSGVTTIEGYAFDDCDNLTSITIPASVTTIEETSVFDYCGSLKDIYYCGSESQWTQIFDGGDPSDVLKLNGVTIHYNSSTPASETPGQPKFTDTPSWCAKEAQWAVERKITNGYGGNDKFAPNNDCTVQEILTFLWRAEKHPKYTGKAPMDVPSWYADGVNWAYSEGLIDEQTDPASPCTRAQAVTFIWKARGELKAVKTASFPDVAAGDSYADAVDWASEKGVTQSYGGTGNFAPDRVCNRGQIACFLYRAYN